MKTNPYKSAGDWFTLLEDLCVALGSLAGFMVGVGLVCGIPILILLFLGG